MFSKHKPHAGRRNRPPSNSAERRTKHIFPVNLLQIRSTVPEIFHTQQKVTDSAKNRTLRKLRSSLRAVKTLQNIIITKG